MSGSGSDTVVVETIGGAEGSLEEPLNGGMSINRPYAKGQGPRRSR